MDTKHIIKYLGFHNREVSVDEASDLLNLLQKDIKSGRITSEDPFYLEADRIQRSLVKIVNTLSAGESVHVLIEDVNRKHYQRIADALKRGNELEWEESTNSYSSKKHPVLTANYRNATLKFSPKNVGFSVHKFNKNTTNHKTLQRALKYVDDAEKQGLGIVPLMVGAAAGKFLEYKIGKWLSGTDEILTEKQAKELGVIDEKGLGFITSPKTAYKSVNARILKEIEKGNLVYRKPWKNGAAFNYETGRPYRGGNAFMIAIQNHFNATGYSRFLTSKQIRERGGKLKKNAEAFFVEAYIKTEKPIVNKKGEDTIEVQEGIIPYVVYPLEHTTGVKLKKNDPEVKLTIPSAHSVVENMPKRPKILNGGNRAFYIPSRDNVQMPLKKAFNSMNEYYSTLFHELIHSTGHKKRVGRDMSGKGGDSKYAMEELIAELGASYLCAVCEIEYFTINNSAAYLKGWSKRLAEEIKNNPRFLMRAVYSATKAANYILSDTLEKDLLKNKNKPAKKSKPAKAKKEKKSKLKVAKTKSETPFKDRLNLESKLKNKIKKGEGTIADFTELKRLLKEGYDDGDYGHPGSAASESRYENELEKLKAFVKGKIGKKASAKKAGKPVKKKRVVPAKDAYFVCEMNEEKEWEFSEVKGERVIIPGYSEFDFFIHKKDKLWLVSEGKTGAKISQDEKTKKLAIESATDTINRHGKERLIQSMEGLIIRVGLSPRYTEILEGVKKSNPGTEQLNFFTESLKGVEVTEISNNYSESIPTQTTIASPAKKVLPNKMSADQLQELEYDVLPLNEYYRSIFGPIAITFDMTIYGDSGAGKTVFLLQFADYLAKNHGKVLYVTSEEYGAATIIDKAKRFGINSPNLEFTKKLISPEVNLKDYKFIFIDSINHAKISLDKYKEIREEHDDKAFILILQTTKDGGYRGGKDWIHEVEVNGKLFLDGEGNRRIDFGKDRYGDKRVVKI